MKISLWKVAGFHPSHAYIEAVRVLSAIVVSSAPYEPPRKGDHPALQQAVKHKSSKYSLGWHDGDPLAFLESAKELPHPAHDDHLSLPEDLKAVVRLIINKRESIADWREHRLQLLRSVAASLEADTRMAVDSMRPHVRHVAGSYHIAFLSACLDATRHPDTFFIRRMVRGFAVHGDIPTCGVFGTGGDPPERRTQEVLTPELNATWNAELRRTTTERGRRANAADSLEAAQQAWKATTEECEEGWTVGKRVPGVPESAPATQKWRGFTSGELDSHPWLKGRGSWRAARRFCIFQGGKWRPIDDMSENGMNSITGSTDKLTLIRADAPLLLSQQFAHEKREWEDRLARRGRWLQQRGSASWRVPDAYGQGIDDVKKAFRRVANADPGLMVVCVFNPISAAAEFFLLPSFVFGCYSAVLAWNRVSAAYTHVSRRLIACPSLAYFDDFPTGTPYFDAGSAQQSQSTLFDLFRLGFAPAKHVPWATTSVALGVQSDWSSIAAGVVTVGVTEERRQKLRVTIRDVLGSGVLTHAAAVKVFGKSRWVLCPVFGRVGIALLQPLQFKAKRAEVVPGSDLELCLVALLDLLRVIRPVSVPLFPILSDPPVVVLTDASYSWKGGGLGVVIWCPVRRMYFYTACPVPAWLMMQLRLFEVKATYICQLELVAMVMAYLTFPDLLSRRLVHHFVDNQAARSSVIRGYSPKTDCAAIIHELHIKLVQLMCNPWIGFVYSEDNLSDDPSRGRFDRLAALGAQYREPRLPNIVRCLRSPLWS